VTPLTSFGIVPIATLSPGRIVGPVNVATPRFQLVERIHMIENENADGAGSGPDAYGWMSSISQRQWQHDDDSAMRGTHTHQWDESDSHINIGDFFYPRLRPPDLKPKLAAPPLTLPRDRRMSQEEVADAASHTMHVTAGDPTSEWADTDDVVIIEVSDNSPTATATSTPHVLLHMPSYGSRRHDDGAADHASEYELKGRVGRGHFGELWRARRVDGAGVDDSTYVLKRLFVERGMRTRLSGLREIHFGLKMRRHLAERNTSMAHDRIARLVEWFEEEAVTSRTANRKVADDEPSSTSSSSDSLAALWLVFRDEGESLTHWLTEPMPATTSASSYNSHRHHRQHHHTSASPTVVQPSANWSRMKLQTGWPNRWRKQQTDETMDENASEDADQSSHNLATAIEGRPFFGPFLPSPPPSTLTPPILSMTSRRSQAQSPIESASAISVRESGHVTHSSPTTVRSYPALPTRQIAVDEAEQHSVPSTLPATGTATATPPATTFDPDSTHSSRPQTPVFPYGTTPPHFDGQVLKSILYQLLQAVAGLHEAGITHRDIKPDNILLHFHSGSASSSSRTSNPDSKGRHSDSGSDSSSQAEWSQPRFTLRLCDFGSALDDDPDIQYLLYPPPHYTASRRDNTAAYAPPEAIFGYDGDDEQDDDEQGSDTASDLDSIPSPPAFSATHPHSYDLWSVGVVAVELLIGPRARSELFSIDQRVRARIERKVEEEVREERRKVGHAESNDSDAPPDSSSFSSSSTTSNHPRHHRHHHPPHPHRHPRSEAEWAALLRARQEKAVLFRAFVEYGIYTLPDDESESEDERRCAFDEGMRDNGVNGHSASHDAEYVESAATCGDVRFHRLLRASDPLGIGAGDVWLVKLIRRLLRWDPAERMSAHQALTHAYFVGPYTCKRCGEKFETHVQLNDHIRDSHAQSNAAASSVT